MAPTSLLKRLERSDSDTTVAFSSMYDTSAQVPMMVSERSAQLAELGHKCRPAAPVRAASVRPTNAQHMP